MNDVDVVIGRLHHNCLGNIFTMPSSFILATKLNYIDKMKCMTKHHHYQSTK